jgi:hypothetical protein
LCTLHSSYSLRVRSELSAIPTSLFKDNLMSTGKPDKSELAREVQYDLSNLSDKVEDITKLVLQLLMVGGCSIMLGERRM